MHIVYFVQYFNLPHEAGGSRPYQFARAWVAEGHRVTIVTGAVNHKTLSVPDKYRGRLFTSEDVDGFRVVRVWSYAGIKGSFKRRLVNFLSYAASAMLAGLFRAGRPDVVFASSTPLTAGLPGLMTSALRRAPFVFEARDLWPQSAVVAGVLDGKALPTRAAAWLAGLFYRKAKRLVAVTRGIGEGMKAEGADPDKVLFIPNGVDDWMLAAGDPWPEEGGESFKVVYCGAHGRWNGLGQIIDAFEKLADDPRIGIEFVGDGDEREDLEARASELGLERVRFRGALPKKDAFGAIRGGNASLVVTWAHPFQRMVLANKIFDYLAAGRPVIVGAEGEMAELVREAGCGFVVPPEQPDQLAGAIRRMAALTSTERDEMGARGRRYILENYQRRDLALKLLREFEEITERPAAAREEAQRS